MNGPKQTNWPFSRRKLFQAGGLLATMKTKLNLAQSPIPGKLSGASFHRGHELMARQFPKATKSIATETLIVGGGVSGLSAGHFLKKNKHSDFLILELEKETGGNARSGTTVNGKFPLGAHYITIPSRQSELTTGLLREMGVITHIDPAGRPNYDLTQIASDPQERLFIHGRWQTGLIPQLGLTKNEHADINKFLKLMSYWQDKKGRDNKKAFAIPMALSSKDPELLKLDTISFETYLKGQGLHSRPLHWYVNYCCLDDYATPSSHTSAWAGIHYFSCREKNRAVNASDSDVITWPEGNAKITNYLTQKCGEHIRDNQMCFHLEYSKNNWLAQVYDYKNKQTLKYTAKQIIFAAPQFLLAHILPTYSTNKAYKYIPWMVGNIHLKKNLPSSSVPLCWDNVIYGKDSLGYINSQHQTLKQKPNAASLTFYQPFYGNDLHSIRSDLISRTHPEWCQHIFRELTPAHPDLKNKISSIDIWLWGHGMISPQVNFLFGGGRRVNSIHPTFHFAHSELSGLSLFEEAQHRGIAAAQKALSFSKKHKHAIS